MKRNETLQPISRQHKHDLMGCLLLKKGIANRTDPEILKDFTLYYWNNELHPHMQTEEEHLIPFLSSRRYNEKQINMIRNDHELIRIIIERIEQDGNTYKLYEILSDVVVQHTRYEERIVFNRMQETFDEMELSQVGRKFTNGAICVCQNYPVKFWE